LIAIYGAVTERVLRVGRTYASLQAYPEYRAFRVFLAPPSSRPGLDPCLCRPPTPGPSLLFLPSLSLSPGLRLFFSLSDSARLRRSDRQASCHGPCHGCFAAACDRRQVLLVINCRPASSSSSPRPSRSLPRSGWPGTVRARLGITSKVAAASRIIVARIMISRVSRCHGHAQPGLRVSHGMGWRARAGGRARARGVHWHEDL
jgi:hypothetical protein